MSSVRRSTVKRPSDPAEESADEVDAVVPSVMDPVTEAVLASKFPPTVIGHTIELRPETCQARPSADG